MGYLAWKATSIVPLVIAHTSSDIFTGLMSRNVIDSSYIFADSLVLDTGLDTHFVFWSGMTILCIVLVIYAGQKLNLLST